MSTISGSKSLGTAGGGAPLFRTEEVENVAAMVGLGVKDVREFPRDEAIGRAVALVILAIPAVLL